MIVCLLQKGVFEKYGALGKIRTPDPQIRSLVLYPAELRAHNPTPGQCPVKGWRTIGEAPDAGKTLSSGQPSVLYNIHLLLDRTCLRRTRRYILRSLAAAAISGIQGEKNGRCV